MEFEKALDDDLLEFLLRQINVITIDNVDVDAKDVSATIVYKNGGETDCRLPIDLFDYLTNRLHVFGKRKEAKMRKATDDNELMFIYSDAPAYGLLKASDDWFRDWRLGKGGWPIGKGKECPKECPAIRHVVEGEKGGCRLVTVVFEDGTHETAKCVDGDAYDVNVGAALCVAYKAFGSRTAFRNEVAAKTAKPKPEKAKGKPAGGKPKAKRGRPRKVLNEASEGK